MGRDREPLRTGGELAAVDLVGDDRIGESQCIPVPQTAPLEDPMVGTADRVGARGSRDTEAVARVPATREGQPGRAALTDQFLRLANGGVFGAFYRTI